MNFNEDQHPDFGSPIYPIVSHDVESDASFAASSNASTPSTIIYDLEAEPAATTVNDGTILLSSGTESSMESEQHSMQMSQTWDPMAISTPIVTTAPRSHRDIENELFYDIEQLVRQFLRRPHLDYPYYRVIRWLEGENPQLEYVVTVVINRPTVHQNH